MHHARIAGIAALLLALVPARAEPPRLLVVVHKSNPVASIPAAQLTDFFLKKRTRWADGTPVRFIDWREGSPQRTAFLEKVVRKSSREVELYWIGQKLYTGDSAPIRATSESTVVRFVSSFKGAIGYISNPTSVGSADVKVIELLE
jgi:ABC-type phosphate transport system substrate-binding protein